VSPRPEDWVPPEVKSCRFCHSRDLAIHESESLFSVACLECEVAGEQTHDLIAAIESWNKDMKAYDQYLKNNPDL
jgi:hypothetical protein